MPSILEEILRTSREALVEAKACRLAIQVLRKELEAGDAEIEAEHAEAKELAMRDNAEAKASALEFRADVTVRLTAIENALTTIPEPPAPDPAAKIEIVAGVPVEGDE